MIKQALHDGWSVRAVSNLAQVPGNIRDRDIPARVPGCIHTDLLRAGLIDDPYFGANEPKLLWIGLTDWQYTTYFDADPRLFDHERIDLVCDGLDTVATIWLNGSEVARTQNMHRGYRFDIRPMLKKERNELVIRFDSPVNYANAMRDKLGFLPYIGFGSGPFNFIRKMACNFGWDWGPVVATCGIWRGVRVEGWSIARLKQLSPRLRVLERDTAILHLEAQFEYASKMRPRGSLFWKIFALNPESELRSIPMHSFDEGDATVDVSIESPRLWFPTGHGDQPLYEFRANLDFNNLIDSVSLDEVTQRIGLRTVELDTHPDDIGRGFTLKVNGKPIFCKGFNWIPDDCFPDRACTRERYQKRIQQALDANANMLRVWGGGIYESDEFYDLCDEKGILVWQDFLFACAAYPEAEPFRSEVEAEARENVARLAHHPSLVLWNGCNENLWGYHEWATDDGTGKNVPWKEQLKGKQWGQGYYLDLLPKIVKELDPSRPYWAASPWSGDPDVDNGIHPNAETHGNKHIWEVWHGKGDYRHYRDFTPRFCSEFGYQGPANYSTMLKYFGSATPSPGIPGEGGGEGLAGVQNASEIVQNPHPNPLPDYRERGLKRGAELEAWLAMHQKSPGGNERNDRLLSIDFDIPENFDDWHYLLQLNQARALQTGVEWFRSRQPTCMGTLYWQLNDCYPVTSWSAIDCDGRLKPLWYATRRFYAPRLLTIQPEGDELILFANNDSDEPWLGEVVLRRMSFDGKVDVEKSFGADVSPRTNHRVAKLDSSLTSPSDPSSELIVATLGDARALWYFAGDRELRYPSLQFTSKLEGNRFTVSSQTLLRDVVINIDRIDPEATINENVVTILPGESFTFEIQSAAALSLERLTTPPVFQCANRFGKK